MSVWKVITRPITLPLRWGLGMVLYCITRLVVPVRLRRILFNVSLYVDLIELDVRTITPERVADVGRQLNNLLNLVSSEERSLYFPIYAHALIWGKDPVMTVDQVVTLGLRRSTEYIINQTPRWLRYEYEVMQDDIAVVLRRFLGKEKLLICQK